MNNADLDPEIAALLAAAESGVENAANDSEVTEITMEDVNNLPDAGFSLHEDSNADIDENGFVKKTIHDVDLNKNSFIKDYPKASQNPNESFQNSKYYQICLTNENQSAQRLHQLMTRYLNCQDQKDKAVFRSQIITVYWELLRGMVGKLTVPNFPSQKKMLIRYGILLPSLFKAESKEYFSHIPVENNLDEPILYMDEWLTEILTGRMTNSMTDESKAPSTKNLSGEEAQRVEQSRLNQLQSKNSGKVQSAENLVNINERERTMLERELNSRVEQLCKHRISPGMTPHTDPYDDRQRKIMSEITDILRRLAKNDKEHVRNFDEFKQAKNAYDSVQKKIAKTGGALVVQNNDGALKQEFDTVRQMAKMTIGRQGNQFPVFTREFYHCTEQGTGTRENVLEIMRWIESLDPGAFCRIHKNMSNRIIPYVLLVPTYGDRGFCWEPFDRYNRVTSRARIVVPMYPKDLKIAVITAVADLRWQVAKEKASYYWMEEGLTGQYYQWSEKMKLKGDLKEQFIEDYILWMTKESTGIQRLDKEVRGIFWRNMPFPKDLKEDLRKRSLVYDELCKKDANREMSDGY